MLNKILVALDLNEAYTYVFSAALELAQATKAELKLLSVLKSSYDYKMQPPYSSGSALYLMSTDGSFWSLYQVERRRHKEKGMKVLSALCKQATAKAINADFVQMNGEPGKTICEYAKTENVDLIIVGSHGRKGLSEFLAGSVSNYVMHHAQRSVMIVNHSTPAKIIDKASSNLSVARSL